jgi:hypothetical protein
MKKTAGKTGNMLAKGLGGKLAGLTALKSMTIENEGDGFMAGLDMEEANDDDVEAMLKGGSEKDKAMKADRRQGNQALDLNDAAVVPKSAALGGLAALAQLAKKGKKKKKEKKPKA